jgi:hypothetical protein
MNPTTVTANQDPPVADLDIQEWIQGRYRVCAPPVLDQPLPGTLSRGPDRPTTPSVA